MDLERQRFIGERELNYLSVEDLISFRVKLAEELGKLQATLAEVNRDMQGCLLAMIEISDALRDRGVDLGTLLLLLYPPDEQELAS